MPEDVTLITPTGMRTGSFLRCAFYVFRFTRPDDFVQWIVVDDGEEPMPIRFDGLPKNISMQVIRPEHRWTPGSNTLAKNLLAAIPEVVYDKILIIEDDDFYSAEYLAVQAARLENYSLIGEIPTRYYHVPSSRCRIFENRVHASLCQTGMRKSRLPELEKICRSPDFIDVRLWNQPPGTLFKSNLCVGMKGLPGREGLGIGHKPVGVGWRADPDRKVLRNWLGADAALYEALNVPETIATDRFKAFTGRG